MWKPLFVCWLGLFLVPNAWSVTTEQQTNLLQLRSGFSIKPYGPALEVENARQLAVSGGAAGPIITYVGSRTPGKVYALVDKDGDGVVDFTVDFLTRLGSPAGVAWFKGSLIVAYFNRTGVERTVIAAWANADQYALLGEAYPDTIQPKVLNEELPAVTEHGPKYLRVSPNRKRLYVAFGQPCNNCSTEPWNGLAWGSILSMPINGGKLKVIVSGLRNSVGYDWHPTTGELHMTDNGRDGLGNNQPDDELNKAPKIGTAFGAPFCLQQGRGDPYQRPVGPGRTFPDPYLNPRGSVMNCNGKLNTQPVQLLGPHVAALGMRFYRAPAKPTAVSFPSTYHGTALIAQHGSWNRIPSIGFRVMAVQFGRRNLATAYVKFIEGWLQRGDPADNLDDFFWGRPVDIVQLPDGSILISDDYANTVYRVTYSKLPLKEVLTYGLVRSADDPTLCIMRGGYVSLAPSGVFARACQDVTTFKWAQDSQQRLQNRRTGLCLDLAPLSQVTEAACSRAVTQKWIYTRSQQLKQLTSSVCLTLSSKKVARIRAVKCSDTDTLQKWNGTVLVAAQPPALFAPIRSLLAAYDACLQGSTGADGLAAGGAVVASPCSTDATANGYHLWSHDEEHRLVSSKSRLCVTVKAAPFKLGSLIVQSKCLEPSNPGASGQRFSWMASGELKLSGSPDIQSPFCLGVPSVTPDVQLALVNCTGSPAPALQRWTGTSLYLSGL